MPAKIEREDLIAELERLVDELGKVPTRTEMNDHGKYSRTPYDTEFGSWNKALEAAGMDRNKPTNMSEDDLIEELQRVANELGKTPTQNEFREHSKTTERAYKDRFGSWNDALRAADLEVNKPHGVEHPTLVCEYCGEEYCVKPSKSEDSRYCSNECKNNAKQSWTGADNPHPNAGQRIEIECEWCGDKVTTYPNQKGRKRFCSLDCLGSHNADVRNGEDSPRWRGGYEEYYGPIWEEKRKEALDRDNHRCQECGESQQLIVHHKTPFRDFVHENGSVDYEEAHRLDNLITYCRSCHAKIENGTANGFGD